MIESQYSSNTTKQDDQTKKITKTFITGQNSCTIIIPKTVALEYGLTSPSHVAVERVQEGILIRKLKIEY
jgi:hypothetical protein